MIEKKLKVPKGAIKRMEDLCKEEGMVGAISWYLMFKNSNYDARPLKKVLDKYKEEK